MKRRTTDTVVERIRSHRQSRLFEFSGEILLPKRKELGLTQRDIAECVGIHQTTYSRIERGEEAPKDPATAQAIAQCLHLDAAEREAWLGQLYHLPPAEMLSAGDIFRKYGLSIRLSDLDHDEYSHIELGRRGEVFADAAELINNLAPSDEKERRKLRQAKDLDALGGTLRGINTYIDHETDHAVMLILDWLERNDATRWRDLHENLERLIDLAYRQARASGLDLRSARVLNTSLCYAHRFGPPVLADKSMRYALRLAEGPASVASAYILRDMLHCDIFRHYPRVADRFHDFQDQTFRATRGFNSEVGREIVPGLDLLYFASSVWVDQRRILKHQLLPDTRRVQSADWARVLQQTLIHVTREELPALSLTNYILTCLRVIEGNRSALFQLLSPHIVEQMVTLASAEMPSEFRGDPLLDSIWSEMVRRFMLIERAWGRSGVEFRAELEGRWD